MNSDLMLANAIRFLSMDAIQKSKSGHPGLPMGMADIATVLWCRHLKHNPKNPSWFNRDRFILSNGHGSMLLYSLLHLTGYDLQIDDLKCFRQWNSKTPGHPEYGDVPGVETTTGPLGQGLANGVGIALAEKLLANSYNRPLHEIINHFTYVFVGDGCLMEGISHEVSSLAGTLNLGKLIVFWDDNGISIDGNVRGWFNEDVAKRYEAYGWHVLRDVDGHNFSKIDAAIYDAQKEVNNPTLICCKTNIGQGSPNKAGDHNVHGSPLGEEEISNTRQVLNWHYEPFEIPDEIYKKWSAIDRGAIEEEAWNKEFSDYKKTYPNEFKELNIRLSKILPEHFSCYFNGFLTKILDQKLNVSTRKASQYVLEELCKIVPGMFGGSADLTPSNLTAWSGSKWVNNCFEYGSDVNYLSYGVREFGMSSMMNGMSLHGGFKPYGGTFLVFSDYARSAIRMSAIMKQPVIYIMTHDSIGLGEDGPTHQPIEHLPSLRVIPNLNVWRPADSIETAVAWRCAVEETKTPSLLALSRQDLPALVTDSRKIPLISKGGYLLKETQKPEITLIATGSEVSILYRASELLLREGIFANIVSIPCVEKFLQQDIPYQESVILPNIPGLVMEAAQIDLWYRLLPKSGGHLIGLNHFGSSAPAQKLYEIFGLTAENAVVQVKALLKKSF